MQIRLYGCQIFAATFKSGLLCELFFVANGWWDVKMRKMGGRSPGDTMQWRRKLKGTT